MNLRTVAIHQPNFFPWLGFFDKIVRADVFILLDDVQFSKKGGTWTNRVRWIVNGAAEWVTVPVVRAYHGTRKINEMKIDNERPWKEKMLRLLEENYGRASCFGEIMPWLKPLVAFETEEICRYNLNALWELVRRLDLSPEKLVRSSELGFSKTGGTELLVSLVKSVEGQAYLVGGGASGYQDDALFEREGIRIIAQNFQPTPYPQVGGRPFVPGLSVIDALLNCGERGTRDLILSRPG